MVADNTWATPLLTRPLALGAHVAMHSTTKYVGGHSDVLGGAVPSPFGCWLLLRSLSVGLAHPDDLIADLTQALT